MNSLTLYLVVALMMFCIGMFGLLQRRSLIGMIISIELMLNAAAINFMAFNRFLAPDPAVGQVMVLFIMGIAAAEAAIALSLILALFRKIRSINIEHARDLGG